MPARPVAHVSVVARRLTAVVATLAIVAPLAFVAPRPVVAATSPAAAPEQAAPAPSAGRVELATELESEAVRMTNQVVVTWDASIGDTKAQREKAAGSARRALALSTAAGQQVFYVRSWGKQGRRAIYALDTRLGDDAGKILGRLAKLPDVDVVEPDYWVAPPDVEVTAMPNDPQGTLASLWGLRGPDDTPASTYGLNVDNVWGTTTGSGVTVAVIDTGIRPHVELAGQYFAGYDFITNTLISNDGDGRDGDPTDPGDWVTSAESTTSGSPYFGCQVRNSSWHGAHVSGTIAALTNNFSGIYSAAPNSKILPLRALGKCGGVQSDIIDAITWASGGSVSGVAANANPAKVINMSLISYQACSPTYQAAVTAAYNRGSLIVVGAGNDNFTPTAASPTLCKDVQAVASIDVAGARSTFSNYGSFVAIAAPGTEIVSTINTGTTVPVSDTGLGIYSGTSMATPHVAGLAALLFQAYPSAQPGVIAKAIRTGVLAFPAVANACTTSICGAGIANAPAALTAMATADLTAPTVTVARPAALSNATTLNFTVSFSENIVDFTSADLSTSGTATGCVIGTPVATGGQALWNVPVTGCSTGSLTLTLAAKSVDDNGGNRGPAAAVPSTGMLVDVTPPVSALSITPTLTNNVTTTAAWSVTDVGSSLASLVGYYSSSPSLTSPTQCGAVNLPAASGAFICSLPSVSGTYYFWSIATDNAGNVETTPASADDSVTIDLNAPTASLAAPATPNASATLNYTLAFSEAITGLASTDFTRGGTATGCVVGTPTFSTSWNVPVTGCSEGTVTLQLNQNTVLDVAGNAGPAIAAGAATVTIDRTGPTSSVSIAATVTSGTSVSVGYTASDPSGMGAIAIYYSTAANLASPVQCQTLASAGTSGTTSCTIPAVDGTYYFFSRASDALGNLEAAPGVADDTILRDAVAPTVVVTPPTSPTNDSTPTYQLAFSESVSGLTTGDFGVTGTAGCSVQSVGGAGASWSVTLTCPGQGTALLTMSSTAVTDAGGNAGPGSVSIPSITIDTVAPTLESFVFNSATDTGRLSNDRLTNSTTPTFDLVFSEPVSMTYEDLQTIQVTGCFDWGTLTQSGNTWSIQVLCELDAPLQIGFLAVTAKDAAGNLVANSDASPTATLDYTAPTLGLFQLSPSLTNSTAFEFWLQGNEAIDCGTVSTTNNVDFVRTNISTLTVTPSGVDTCVLTGTSSIAAGATGSTSLNPAGTFAVADDAGNVATTVEGTTFVTVDRQAPTLSIVPAALGTTTGAMTFALQFSEPIQFEIVDTSDFSVGGTATGCAVSNLEMDPGGVLQVTVSGCGTGTMILRMAANSTNDGAGNLGPAALTSSPAVTVDTVAPTVTAPTITPRTGVALSGSAIPVTVRWTGTDNAGGSGIQSYRLERSTDGGATWGLVSAAVTTTSFNTTIASSGSVRFRVKGVDNAGLESAFAAMSSSRSGRLVQQSSSSVKYPTAWTSVSGSSYSGGSARYTRTAGRSASYTFTGRSIALVSTRATNRGKVKVYINGVLQATVDTVRSSTQYRSVVWQKTYSSTVTRTIKIVVSGTSGRPRVDLDAFVVIK